MIFQLRRGARTAMVREARTAKLVISAGEAAKLKLKSHAELCSTFACQHSDMLQLVATDWALGTR